MKNNKIKLIENAKKEIQKIEINRQKLGDKEFYLNNKIIKLQSQIINENYNQ
ncbi:hypothetical protein [Staphylococcus gallinarum]|uniref:hypothetical protein n=1 Tax=Staphylococcus gallinarum TaxID=1293 RepID=UPI0030C1F56D